MKTKNAAKTESDLRSKIKDAYIDFVLTEGKNPASIYHFCKKLETTEAEFYKHFNSFEKIASDIWTDFLADVIQKLEESEAYATFGVREKILSFFYAAVEQMKSKRSYISWSSKGWFIPGKSMAAKKAVEKILEPFFEKLLAEGYQTGQLADRKKISDFYPKAMLIQFWFVLEFWLKDESTDFEDTDAAIEKGVNLGFDLMQENSLDKAFDLAKFLWSRSKSN